MRLLPSVRWCGHILLWACLPTTLTAQGPLRKPAILFCSPQGATFGWVDRTYLGELQARGFEIDFTETLADITWERIKRYNVLVVFATPDSFDVVNAGFKTNPRRVQEFAALMDKYVATGGGVFLMPTEQNILKQAVAELTDQWGAKLPVELIEEKDKTKLGALRHANQHIPLGFTDQVLPSPVSAGVRQIWYPISPAYNAQQTGPIIVDEKWQVVVKASKTSHTQPIDLKKSNMPELANPFSRPGGVPEPAIFAIRPDKAGRLALINQWRQFSIGAGTKFIYDRQVLSSGVDGRPSDFGKLLENTFRWLAEPSLVNGAVGGYVTPPDRLVPENQKPQVKKDYEDRFWPYDPKKLGVVEAPPNTRILRGLIGARTTYSTGKSSVADYAKAAITAGLDFVVILEEFSHLTPEKLKQLTADCKKHSNEKVNLLPGFTIRNNIGNDMFFFSPEPAWIPDYCLTGPNKKLLYIQQQDDKGRYTGYLTPFLDWVLNNYHVDKGQVGYYNFKGAPHGMRMHDLRLYSMVALRYYKEGQVVESLEDDHPLKNLLHNYLITVSGTIPPSPVSLNEVRSVAEMIREVQEGHALTYARAHSPATVFRDALHWTHQYESPNVFVSDGPRIQVWPETYRVWTLGAEEFVTGRAVMPSSLWVTAEAGLKEIRIFNGAFLYRRFLPGGAKEFKETLVLDGTIQKNLVVVAEDNKSKQAVSFARRCWKDGSLAPVFCSDHVNDCTSGPLLAHGPLSYPCIRHPSLPTDIAGDTWDGGPLASLPLTGNQDMVPVLTTNRGSEDGHRFDQTPILRFSDEGSVSVDSQRMEVFDDKVLNVVNPWNTFGPIRGGSDYFWYRQIYQEFVQPTVGNPQVGWAAVGVRAGGNAALFGNWVLIWDRGTIKSLSLGYFTGNPKARLAIHTREKAAVLDLSQPPKGEKILLKSGDWFGYFSPQVSNSNLFINRGEPLWLENQAPYVHFRADINQKIPAQDWSFPDGRTWEIAALGFPLNVKVQRVEDLERYAAYLEKPTGLKILRGERKEGPGLLELSPDKNYVVELVLPRPQRKMDLTLPCRISGQNPNWSAGLFQKEGYVKGDYGSGKNRYRALGVDHVGFAYIPLYVDLAEKTHILAGHPVVADSKGKDLFIQVTKVGVNPDRWHLSVNNPTNDTITTPLWTTMDLPGLKVPAGPLTLKPGEYRVVSTD